MHRQSKADIEHEVNLMLREAEIENVLARSRKDAEKRLEEERLAYKNKSLRDKAFGFLGNTIEFAFWLGAVFSPVWLGWFFK